ncbi:MAG: T9SS type A sorting domain-containing protein [Fibrobacterota bacterium]
MFSQDVKLLTSFEYDQMQTWGWNGDSSSGYGTLFQGDATDSSYALGKDFGASNVSYYLSFPQDLGNTGFFNAQIYRMGTVFMTKGHFGSWLGTDWSGYDRLRIDIKSTVDSCVVWLQLQDETSSPFLIRKYVVPANSWVTLEYDLARANRLLSIPQTAEGAAYWGVDTLKGRLLNPAKLTNININAVAFYGKRAERILIDNMRLLKAGADDGSALQVVRDTSALPAVQALPMAAPSWAKYAGARDKTPLSFETPSVIDYGSGGNYCYPLLSGIPYAIAAVDNNRLIMAGWIYGAAKHSVDGGKTWTSSGSVLHSQMAPGNYLCGSGDDLLVFYTESCAGGVGPSAFWFRQFKFNGTGWDLSARAMIHPNTYHCAEWKVTGVRQNNGRIWMAANNDTRYGGRHAQAIFSDDGGGLWRSQDAAGVVDGESARTYGLSSGKQIGIPLWVENSSKWSYSNLHTLGTLSKMPGVYTRPMIIPYGENAACLFNEAYSVKWSRFDGSSWSTPATILNLDQDVYTAVTYHSDSIYFSVNSKVYVFNGSGSAVDITPPDGKGGVLSLSGNTLLTFWQEQSGSEYLIRYSTKELPDGNWSPAATLATETVSCKLSSTMVAPENFFPVAWAYTGTTSWIKFLRIPNDNYTGVEKKETKAQPSFFLKNSPNPFRQSTVFNYGLPTSGNVSITIYDRCGRLVTSLVQGQQEAGQHKVRWNAHGMATGVYFVKIKANGLSVVNKTLIVR